MISPQPTDALLVIDMQNDFLPGGALAVAGGDAIIPGINVLATRFEHVLLTQDWHPGGHISFASTHAGKRAFTDTVEAAYGLQTLWPEHAQQGTTGAAITAALDIPHAELVLRKGFRKGIDSYSAFFENDKSTPTGLAGFLRERGLTRLFFCGLALDFCVGYSALDAVRLGFATFVVDDLSRAVDLPRQGAVAGSVEHITQCMKDVGVQQISASAIVEPNGAGPS